MRLLVYPLPSVTEVYLGLDVVWFCLPNMVPDCKATIQILASSTVGFFREHHFVLSSLPCRCRWHIRAPAISAHRRLPIISVPPHSIFELCQCAHWLSYVPAPDLDNIYCKGLKTLVEVNCVVLKNRLKLS